MAIQIRHVDDESVRLPMIARDARLVVWPGMGAIDANLNYVVMEPGEENVPHRHPVSEDTIVVFAGSGTIVNLDSGSAHSFEGGQVVHVPVGVQHQVRADRGTSIVSVGGPCPADLVGLRRAGVLGEDPLPGERDA